MLDSTWKAQFHGDVDEARYWWKEWKDMAGESWSYQQAMDGSIRTVMSCKSIERHVSASNEPFTKISVCCTLGGTNNGVAVLLGLES